MSKNTIILIAVFIGAAGLSYLLTTTGWNSSKSEGVEEVSDIPEHQEQPSADTSSDVTVLLKEAYEIIYEQKGAPMQGILKYKKVLEIDSNNIEAIYQLGILSIQSNQLEKAADRFKKLILLQPENQEYKDQYDQILEKLGQ